MPEETAIPRTAFPDSTIALFREGYLFIGNRCRRFGSDLFRTRLMLRDVICMRGAEAAEIFYSGDRFTRRQAMPVTVLKLLQDRGSVQLLDGARHRHRKQMFMAMMTTPDALARLGVRFEEEWQRCLPCWTQAGAIVLCDELRRMLTAAVCAWAGVPLTREECAERAREFSAMIDATGSIGPRNWRALMLRRKSERWAREKILALRRSAESPEHSDPVHIIAAHRDLKGNPLDAEVAAVELLNVLRPTVAISNFLVFAALALHHCPDWLHRLTTDDEADLEAFVQEVRRTAPFFPFISGRVASPFIWRGHRFEDGQWVLLDLYGTCHDARVWPEPDKFRPERFRDCIPGPFALVPQGAGQHLADHRCPGEWITIDLMKRGARLLAKQMRYDVPEQDLRVDLAIIPAMPKSRMRLVNVRAA